MQTLIPFALALSLTSATQLSLLPYAYLVDPLPVYHQSQDTRTGEHAYSYSGGPSAKEEVKGLDGITRGSYSYVDANGHLQSVFYVADEDGFRVAATNLPTDDDLPPETTHVKLARSAHFAEHAKALASGRKRRSLESQESAADSTTKEQAENVRSSKDHENQAEPVQKTVYGPSGSVSLPSLAATATSRQSRYQVHSNQRIEPFAVDNRIEIEDYPSVVEVGTGSVNPLVAILQQPVASTLFYSSQVPTAVSHQSRAQIHRNVRVESFHAGDALKVEPVAKIAEPQIHLSAIPVLNEIPTFHENRIQIHKNLGLEGPNRRDAIKIKTVTPLATVNVPFHAVPVESLPYVQYSIDAPFVATAVSSQSRSQVHANTKIEISPSASAVDATAKVQALPVSSVSVAHSLPLAVESVPLATSSQSRSQIHSSEKLETLVPVDTL